MSTSKIIQKIATILTICGTLIYGAPILSENKIPNKNNVNSYIEVDIKAFQNNIKQVKKLLEDKSKICVVMKADAYGNGIETLLPTIKSEKISCVGVTGNAEIKLLRKLKYRGEILRIRTATLGEIKNAIKYNVTETLGNLIQAQAINNIAKNQVKKIPIHINLNSAGMDRNGVDMSTEEGKKEAVEIAKQPYLKITGIMTHYPMEDIQSIKAGLAKFQEDSSYLIKAAKLDRKNLTLHTANSIATLNVLESRLDMVRPGALVYGDQTIENQGYKQVTSFKSSIAVINSYPKGSKVAYDGTYTLTRDSKLANIPLGYSDGYSRAFSNKGKVLIRGHKVPVVGRITMNTFMVDVTDFPDIEMNDEVVLFGKQCEEEITQNDIEEITGMIMAEVIAIWGNSNPLIKKDYKIKEVCNTK